MPYKITPSCLKAILGSMLTLLFVLAFCLPGWTALTKGIQVVVKDRQGRNMGLYKGSYALLIGAARYSGGWPSLTSVTHEMKAVKEALEKAGFVVEMAPDPDAKGLRSSIEGFINRYGYDPENRLLLFFSGHGYTRKEGKKGYLVPVDAPDPREDDRVFLLVPKLQLSPCSQAGAWEPEGWKELGNEGFGRSLGTRMKGWEHSL